LIGTIQLHIDAGDRHAVVQAGSTKRERSPNQCQRRRDNAPS
jgi:hypothetical protein